MKRRNFLGKSKFTKIKKIHAKKAAEYHGRKAGEKIKEAKDKEVNVCTVEKDMEDSLD